MKKINILLAIVMIIGLSLQSISQDKLTIPTKDSTSFYWKNGKEEIVKVSFIANSEVFDIMSEGCFSNCVISILSDAKFNLKNKRSYIPIKVAIISDEKGGVMSSVEYVGTNSYGAELETETMYIINPENGNILKEF